MELATAGSQEAAQVVNHKEPSWGLRKITSVRWRIFKEKH